MKRGTPRDPRRRDSTRPLELLGLSAGIALVVGVIVFAASHRPQLALIWTGLTFIVVVVSVAMLVLAADPEARRRSKGDEPRGH